MIPVFVLVDEMRPFQQLTRNTANIMWREEPLSELERNNENGVTVQVCVVFFSFLIVSCHFFGVHSWTSKI